MTTDLSRKQLTTVLSALGDVPRNPANKGEALKALTKSAQRYRLGLNEVLAAAPGLLDGRLSPADFRVALGAPRGGLTRADHRAASAEGRTMRRRLVKPAGSPRADSRSGRASLTLPVTAPPAGLPVDAGPFEERRRTQEWRLSGRCRLNWFQPC